MTMAKIYCSTAPIAIATALALAPVQAFSQVVEKPLQENAATVVVPPADGFSIRVNGEVLTQDQTVANIARQTDVALADADVQITFDGLGAKPRLDFELTSENDTLTLQSALNYPSFVERAEFRLIDLSALGGAKTVRVIPVSPNGGVTTDVPSGDNVVVVHRVYDANGRFDETEAISLATGDRRANASDVEEGNDLTRIRRIPINGGAVTVRGSGVAQTARVNSLGETLRADSSGGFVLQRILPVGTHDVRVVVQGSGYNVDQTRRIIIPRSEWFRTGTVDLTYHLQDGDNGRITTQTGRVAGYIDGRTASGVAFTASVDTGEGELSEIFRDLDEKDPRQLLLRVDPADLYPTYGDDSELVDNTPTSGKIYARVSQDNNFALWGDFTSQLEGNTLVRNERSLYGLQLHGETQTTVANGQPQVSLDAYAAQPGRLPQRDVFLGSGGSIYFLEKQDIGTGSETISIQIKDPQTGRIVETRALVAGRDYEINYIQGIVTLAAPLQSTVSQTTVVTDPTAAGHAQLVIQYEYTPTAGDLDGFSYGGRIEGWANDQLRFGVSGLQETTGIADQTLLGIDLRYEVSERSYFQIDLARSEGAGFGSTFSNDGGLIVDTNVAAGGTGNAIKFEGKAGFADFGMGLEGAITGYFEDREEGFSNLDLNVGAATGNERLWGIAVDTLPSEALRLSAYYDAYENGVGDRNNTGGIELSYDVNASANLTIGVSHTDQIEGLVEGSRTDVAARLSYELNDDATVYGFGQKTVARNGLDANDRVGVGGRVGFANGLSLEGEVSDGSLGQGARVLVRQEDGQGNEVYFGYELEPGRELSGVTLSGRDRGRFVTGGKRRLGSDITIFGENTYDAFGQHRSLTSAYGLSYTASEALKYAVAFEVGGVDDGLTTDFERYAVSIGAEYETADLSLSARIENRIEEGLRSGSVINTNSLLYNANLRYKIDESSRLIGSIRYADTLTNESSILNGYFADVSVGYAYRPIENDRLNILARYRYLADLIGQRVDGTDEDGPRQISHVASIDASYDLNPQWTIGGKIGARIAETSASEGDPFVKNDAWLAVGSLTYHAVHEWDALIELRSFNAVQAGTSDISVLAAAYKHFGNNVKLGLGYNFGQFSDDLTDLVQDDQGVFINLVAKF